MHSSVRMFLVAAASAAVAVTVTVYLLRGTSGPAPVPTPLPPAPGAQTQPPPDPHTPVAPGSPNAIAALATRDGAAPPVPKIGEAGANMPRTSVVAFSVAYDQATSAAECVGTAATTASAGLDAGTPASPVHCEGSGARAFDGRLRLSTRGGAAIKSDTAVFVCDASIEGSLTKDGAKAVKTARTDGKADTRAAACDAAVTALKAKVAAEL